MKYFLALFLLSSLTAGASAQAIIPISLTSDGFLQYQFGIPNAGSISFQTDDTSGLRELENTNGSSATWNFAGPSYTVENNGGGTVSLVPYSSSGAPFAGDFTSATHVYEITSSDPTQPSFYTFLKITSDGLWVLGETQDSMGVLSVQEVANPPYQYYKFPMTFGTSWSYSTIISYADQPPDTELATAIVDGYGTLVTPPSDSTPALRLNMKTTDNGYTFDSFYWLTNSFYSAEIDAESDLTPDNATYTEPTSSGVSAIQPSDGLSILLFPNPISNTPANLTYLIPNSGPIQIELIDALGRSVRMLENGFEQVGEHSVPIDATTLRAGTYFVRVEAGGESAMQKLVVE